MYEVSTVATGSPAPLSAGDYSVSESNRKALESHCNLHCKRISRAQAHVHSCLHFMDSAHDILTCPKNLFSLGPDTSSLHPRILATPRKLLCCAPKRPLQSQSNVCSATTPSLTVPGPQAVRPNHVHTRCRRQKGSASSAGAGRDEYEEEVDLPAQEARRGPRWLHQTPDQGGRATDHGGSARACAVCPCREGGGQLRLRDHLVSSSS